MKDSSSDYNLFYLLFLSCTAAIGGFLFGFDSAVINGTIDALQNAFGSSTLGTGFSVSSMLLGCGVGAFYAGTLADKIGRRPIMVITSILFIISAWGSGIATESTEFIIYRLIGGLAVGAASVIAPAYIAEISPPHWRGRLASLQQFAIVIGILSAFLSNYFIAHFAEGANTPFWLGHEAWSWMFWMEILPASLYFILTLIIPESPRFLIANQKITQAKHVMAKAWGSTHVDRELSEIQDTVHREHSPRLADLFENGRLLPIVWVGIGIACFTQLVGINVVIYYGAVMWQAAGFSESDALLINVCSGTLNMLGTLVGMALIDKAGRKPLLVTGSIIMALALTCLAIIFQMAGLDEEGNLLLTRWSAILALSAAHIYLFGFCISWGVVVWVILGEMFNNRIRGAGLAMGSASQWFTNFLITMTFPILLVHIGLGGAYGLYAFFAFLSLFFVLKFVRETKGLKLEEME